MNSTISTLLKRIAKQQKDILPPEAIQLEIDIDQESGSIIEHPTDPVTGMIIPDNKESSIVPAPD